MALFPAIEPSTRSYTFGTWASSEYMPPSGDETRFLHASTVTSGTLNLGFQYLNSTDAQSIRNHFYLHGGAWGSFQLPNIIWRGLPAVTSIFPAYQNYKYASDLSDEFLNGQTYNVSVALIATRY